MTLLFLLLLTYPSPLIISLYFTLLNTGPLAVVWLFHNHGLSNGDLTYIMGVSSTKCLDPWRWLPMVPTTAVLIGVLINVCGNWAGIMPLD